MVCKFLYRNKLLLLAKVYLTLNDWSRKKTVNFVFVESQIKSWIQRVNYRREQNDLLYQHNKDIYIVVGQHAMLSTFGGKQLHFGESHVTGSKYM